LRQKAAQGVPLRRYGQKSEIGHAALFLASPMAAYVTGAVLPVDGGMLLMGARSLGMETAVAGAPAKNR
jgi:NAD(P)-dependent dehydrogenase (short-subunit alcohol dehydrogenase family)